MRSADTATPIIELRDAVFSYNGIEVLTGCSMCIPCNTITALLGLNGSGKSTLFKCLLRQQPISKGQIFLSGKDINEYSRTEIARQIGFVAQINRIAGSDDNVRDFVVEGRTPYLGMFSAPDESDYAVAEGCARIVGCDRFLDKKLSQLSGGQLQMVVIARALTQDTPILVMDEPMSALDISNQIAILRLIRDLNAVGKTVIYSTHNPNHAFALKCNVGVLHNGRIIQYGKNTKVLTQSTVGSVFGEGVAVFDIGHNTYCGIKSIE